MNSYQIGGEDYLIVGTELYKRIPGLAIAHTPEKEPLHRIEITGISTPSDTVLPPARKQPRKPVPQKGYKRGVCGKCGKEGHNAWHCPERAQSAKKSAAGKTVVGKRARKKCLICGERGHLAKTCPQRTQGQGEPAEPEDRMQKKAFVGTMDDLKKRVTEIRAENPSISSLKVAEELGVRIAILNKVWESAPGEDGEPEEE